MFWLPNTNVGGYTDSVSATRISGAWGTSGTAGASNSMGSWTQILSALSYDANELIVDIHGLSVAGTTIEALFDIGVDSAGGTTYQVVCPYLIGTGAAGVLGYGSGIRYRFPIFIKAGSTVAIRGQNSTGSTRTFYTRMIVKNRYSGINKVGSFVEAIGATAASSHGTAITPGTTSDGTWTSIGTTTKETWHVQVGMSQSVSAYSALGYSVDIALDSSGNNIIIYDASGATNTSEQFQQTPMMNENLCLIPPGTTLYARAQCSGTPDATFSVICYCTGG